MLSLYLCNFLTISFYHLWYILSTAVTHFNGVTEIFYVICLLEGNVSLLITNIENDSSLISTLDFYSQSMVSSVNVIENDGLLT